MATCNLNVIVVLEFISGDLFLLFAILLSSKFQNSIFYQHMRPKSGLKFPRPFKTLAFFCDGTGWSMSDLVGNPDDRFSHVAAHFMVMISAIIP